MSLRLRELADRVREAQRLREIVEREGALQLLDPVGLHDLPVRDLGLKLDDGKYAYSWYEGSKDGARAEDAAVEEDASGAGLTSHF